ncbi:hypothetical protein N7448_010767 [Penicillium atrosanguineum]|uniref:Uncharacterized protein n=1 Tax=Penicillium atrosanguineum TaxID=1132637 RepID=A0A9W9KUI9_9EURO|nr:uncharacterized protein N7443_007989 [Penicillium atrosanguineum]KAJ5119059.1 hypothetical protein N7526_010696 [Penicillium atrosanguineum]KAJ5120098.1 hypothetical protein N7448_010767 [Penicillium atrosanguineum]KAJ5297096.1 hypothetical protein N7443_007989 [Penicillium atrosanguineum]KAJ5299855.1 hypothetical protein N7476_011412 [Penicillium atrosanguineum]
MSGRPSNTRSRQKSCVACAGGKRRCNRQTPQCSRCLAHGLKCTYISRQRQQTPSKIQSIDSTSSLSFDDLLTFLPPDDSLFDDVEIPTSWLTPSPYLTVPTLLPAGLYPESAVIDRWSLSQALRSITAFPRMFACFRKTPFIHHRLYDAYLPDAIQDAFTVSSAYCNKTIETEDMVLRILENKSTKLVNQDHQSSTLEELLATMQALLLFHIIQLFDGDIRQRSLAEQNMDTLRVLTMQLQARAADLNSTPTWQEWIFTESIRRTIILSLFIDGLYSALKMGTCSNIRALSVLPFTSGVALWDLTTSASWLSESRDLRSNIVLYGDFSRAFENGRVSGKLDTFQKLLLTPCMGERYREVLEMEA